MRKFQSLRVEGIPFFKDQTFTFDKPGIHVIQGLNLGNRKRTKKTVVPKDASKAHSNMVGKSLFFSCIRELFWKEGVTGKAKDKFKQGKITLALEEGTKKYTLQRYMKGTSERFVIERDGKEVTPERYEDQLKAMQRIIGLDQETFEIIYHLDARVPHPLRVGDTAIRKAFFTKFFNLASADAFRKLVRQEKDSLKQEAAVLAELQAQEKELKTLTKEEVNGLEKQIASYDSKVAKANKELEVLREQRDLARYCSENKKALSLLSRSDAGGNPSDAIAGLQSLQRSLSKELKQHQAAQTYTEALRDWKKSKAAKTAYVEEHGLSVEDKEETNQEADGLTASIQLVQDSLTTKQIEKAKLKSSAEQTQEKLEEAQSDLKNLRKDGECSKCGQKVTNEHYSIEKKELVTNIASLERSLENKIKELRKIPALIDSYRRFISDQKQKQEKVQERLDLYRLVPKVDPRPEQPPEYSLPADWSEETTREQLAKITSKIELLEEINDPLMQPKIKAYLAGDVPDADDEAYDALMERVVLLRQKIAEGNAELATAREHIQARITMRKRMKEIESRVHELEDLEILDQAFSLTGGVKQLQINSICAYLEAKVNEYAKFFFSEDYSFKFDLGTQFHITATRSPEGQKIISDVRKLSGAEAGFFDLMLAISLMTFLPPAKRCNLMILDEIDAGFGPEMTDKFIQFLPKLAAVIPFIIVITPRVMNHYGESVFYHTVVKQGAYSRILPGRVEEVQL